MRIILHPKRKALKGCIAALGTFDGVHRGHQKVIRQAVRAARRKNTAVVVITFDPHPQELAAPERGLRLLTTLEEREELFKHLGVDGVVVVRFTAHTREMKSSDFVRKYLLNRLGVQGVFVGYDYTFGKGRSGNAAELKRLGEKHGFAVNVLPKVLFRKQAVKSSRIREFLSAGEFNLALCLLGHPYFITGKVIKGEGRGTWIGFPTANLKVAPRKLLPAHGVYAGLVNHRRCAVNIGARPTFGAGQTSVEVYIPGFHGNLRGQKLQVALHARLRDEKQFSDVIALKRQIKHDIRRILSFSFPRR